MPAKVSDTVVAAAINAAAQLVIFSVSKHGEQKPNPVDLAQYTAEAANTILIFLNTPQGKKVTGRS